MVLPLLTIMTVAPASLPQMLDSAQVSERGREGEIEGADKTDLGGHGSHLRLGRGSERVAAVVCTDRFVSDVAVPLTAAHLTHLISALGEDGDMFGDDLHAWGMSERRSICRRQDIRSTWHRIIYAHSPKAAFETNFPLPSAAAPVRPGHSSPSPSHRSEEHKR